MPEVRHKYKVGDRVRHRSTGEVRTIAQLDRDIDENYTLDENVDGFYHWGTFDLELVEAGGEETVGNGNRT